MQYATIVWKASLCCIDYGCRGGVLKIEMSFSWWRINKPVLIRSAFCFVNTHVLLTCAWRVVNSLYK